MLLDIITREPVKVMAAGCVCLLCCSCRPVGHGRDGGVREMTIHCCFLSEPVCWWKGKQPHGEGGFGSSSRTGVPRHTGKK